MVELGHRIFYYLNYIIFFGILFFVFKSKIIPFLKQAKTDDELNDKNFLEAQQQEHDEIMRDMVTLDVKISIYQQYEKDAYQWKVQQEKKCDDEKISLENRRLVIEQQNIIIDKQREKKRAQKIHYDVLKKLFINECDRHELNTTKIFDNALLISKNNKINKKKNRSEL